MIRIRDVSYTKTARRQMGELPEDAHDALLEELRQEFRGHELQPGEHVKALLLEELVVRANLFADQDGMLWVESVSAG
mgnify:CR=1 FL=1